MRRFTKKPLIIAHRGGTHRAPENSLDAFVDAIEAGADMVEFDLRQTKDKALVAYHDPLVQGTRVSDLTLAEMRASLGGQRGLAPTFEEIIAATRGRIGLDIELKEDGFEKRVLDLVLGHFDLCELLITSFSPSTLATVRAVCPEMPTGLAIGRMRGWMYPSELCSVHRAHRLGVSAIVPNYRLADLGLATRAWMRQLLVYVWTVNDERLLSRLIRDPQITGIITDVPDLAVSLRDRHTSEG